MEAVWRLYGGTKGQRDIFLTWRSSSTSAARSRAHYPSQKTMFWAVKRPARPYKSAIENRFTMGNAKGA